jgi:hypothetical protein
VMKCDEEPGELYIAKRRRIAPLPNHARNTCRRPRDPANLDLVNRRKDRHPSRVRRYVLK